MKDTLISFNTAKLAKKKGFDWKTAWRYQGSEDLICGGALYNHNCLEEQELWSVGLYSAPSQSFLQKWLRSKYYHININPVSDNKWKYSLSYIAIKMSDSYPSAVLSESFSTYEDALERALFITLKLLP